MPRIKLTKGAIEALAIPDSDLVYWDVGLPGFGVKITPKGRRVFIVLYRVAGGRLRKYTIGPYGRVTLHQAKLAAQKIFTANWTAGTRRLKSARPAEKSFCAKTRLRFCQFDGHQSPDASIWVPASACSDQ